MRSTQVPLAGAGSEIDDLGRSAARPAGAGSEIDAVGLSVRNSVGCLPEFGKNPNWKMEKDDLCTFMCDGVAAAISGDEAKATAFWAGLRLLQPHFTPSELAKFVCNGIASRLKKGMGPIIAGVVERLGPKKAKMVLTSGPLLRVLPEFVEYMSTMDGDALWSAIDTRDKRSCLAEELRVRNE